MENIRTIDIKRAIKDIEKLDGDLRKVGMRATPDIVGFYGELLAWSQLKRNFGWKGYAIKFGKGQTKADATMEKNGNRLNVEVKTSRLKEEWHGVGHGFALNIKPCRIHPRAIYNHPKRGKIYGDFCYFDYLIAVLLSDDLKKKEFYIIPRSFVVTNEKYLRNRNIRFSSGSHRMIFITVPSKSKEITKFDRSFMRGKDKFKNKWVIIK